jgi:aminopeptidase N
VAVRDNAADPVVPVRHVRGSLGLLLLGAPRSAVRLARSPADDDRVPNRMFDALANGLWSLEQADLLEPYVARYFTEGPAVAERRGQAFTQGVGRAFPDLYLDDRQVSLLVEALAGDVPTVLRRVWDDRYDDVTRARVVGLTPGRGSAGEPRRCRTCEGLVARG